MNTFGIAGGLLLVIIGLAVIDYGLDPKVPYAYHFILDFLDLLWGELLCGQAVEPLEILF
jgi:hypothetical protein